MAIVAYNTKYISYIEITITFSVRMMFEKITLMKIHFCKKRKIC